MLSVLGQRGPVEELGDGAGVALIGKGLKVHPARCPELALADLTIERELRLGVGDQAFDEARVKLVVLFDRVMICAA